MAASLTLLPGEATAHPAFEPLRPWLAQLPENPGLGDLNALLERSNAPPVTSSGRPVRFTTPLAHGARHYEQSVFDTGRVETRADNRHDLFNALAWLAFPRAKAAINARHVAAMAQEAKARGPLRDLLTLVDEGGVIVACAGESLARLESHVREFNWQALFWEGRGSLVWEARFVLLGHSAYEKSLDPYPGITCKALFLPVTREQLAGPAATLVEQLDSVVASWIGRLGETATPRLLPPLPVFGFPGWLAGSTHSAFYADRRWFRAAPKPRDRNAAKLERSV